MQEFLHAFTKLEFDKVKKHIQQYAISSLGSDLIEQLKPSASIEEIRSNLSTVSEMKRLLEEHEYPPLENIPDIRVSLQRTAIENFILPSEELYKVQQVLDTSHKINIYFKQKRDNFPLLYQTISELHSNKVLQYNITHAIDDKGEVKDTATKELASVRKRIVEKKDSLKSYLENILKSLSGKDWIQEDIITTREGRMVIPVKVEHKKNVPGFIHSSSASGATVFIEPSETLDLNNDLRTLQFQEQREVEQILRGLTEQVRDVRDQLYKTVELLGYLDFIIAKAKYSVKVLGVEPILSSQGVLRLAKARHPLLLQKYKRDEVVPLDFEFSDNVKTIVITGPNAGGKSVTLKTVGLLAILNQSGCHIPADPDSELPVFTELFVDMGDEQSIESDLSSFSSQLKNLKTILEASTSTSLVLLDEIGSGTDPVEGASIASAVLETLTHSGCKTIATTHHGSLKAFAFETQGIANAAMEFDQSTLRPTYRFRFGVPGSSYALEIASRLQLPTELVSRAKEFCGDESSKVERLILDLERRSMDLMKQLEELATEKKQLNYLVQLYQNQVTSLNLELKSIKAKAIKEASLIVDKANSVIEKIVKDIKEQNAEKVIISKAKEQIKQVSTEVDEYKKELLIDDKQSHNFTIGDTVKLKKTNVIGRIIEQIDEDNYLLLIGDLKVRIHSKELELSIENVYTITHSSSNTNFEPFKPEIDLRGMYGEEAISEIERFLDKAMLSGLQRVDIIHGKGTGALRKKIAEYLKKNPTVKTFRLGEWNEGGSGVTVVELK